MRAHIYILTNNDKKIIAVYIYKLYNIVNYVVFLQFDDNFCIFILFYITRWKHPNGRGYVVFFSILPPENFVSKCFLWFILII